MEFFFDISYDHGEPTRTYKLWGKLLSLPFFTDYPGTKTAKNDVIEWFYVCKMPLIFDLHVILISLTSFNILKLIANVHLSKHDSRF